MPTLKGISDFALFTSLIFLFLLINITVTIMIFDVRLYLQKATASHKWPTDLARLGRIW